MKWWSYIDITSKELDKSLVSSYVEPIGHATFMATPPRSPSRREIRYIVRRIYYDQSIAQCVPYTEATAAEKASNRFVYGGADIRL